jgi:hypothetical protein
MPEEPKWKRFERAVYEIQRQLAADSTVTLDDSIMGADSKTLRQVDISIRRQVAQYSILIAVECKDHKAPLDVKDVEEFMGLAKDVRGNKGALIAAGGFTKAALTLAQTHGIDAFRLVDTESLDWNTYASVSLFIQNTTFAGFRLIFTNFQRLPMSLERADMPSLSIWSSGGDLLGTIQSLLAKRWNESEADYPPGETQVPLALRAMLEFEGSRHGPVDLLAVIASKRKFYLGTMPVHMQGFQDMQTGDIITQEIKTEWMAPSHIEAGLVEGWQEVGPLEELSVKPFMAIVIRAHLPLEKEYLTPAST